MRSLKFPLFLIVVLSLSACTDQISCMDEPKGPYLVFGTFYGNTANAPSYRFFMLKEGELYQLTDVRLNQNAALVYGSVTQLGSQKYQTALAVHGQIPSQLLDTADNVIGCPDCADGGGTYIETLVNGENKYWYIDNTLSDPAYVSPLVETIRAKIIELQ